MTEQKGWKRAAITKIGQLIRNIRIKRFVYIGFVN